jgi:tetratricopeptide (TPR) repeat protein
MPQDIPATVLDALKDRRTLLWLCQRHELRPGEPPHSLGADPDEIRVRYRDEVEAADRRIASFYWEAIWTDSARGLIVNTARAALEQTAHGPEVRRRRPVVLASDPDREGQLDTREFLPIYLPLGLLDAHDLEERYGGTSLRRENYRLNLLRKLEDYPNRLLVVLGAQGPEDLNTVLGAADEFAPVGMSVLVVWPPGAREPPAVGQGRTQIEIWNGTVEEFLNELDALGAPQADFVARFHVRIRNRALELDEADFVGVDRWFTILLERDLSFRNEVDRAVLGAFLRGDEGDWRGYASGLVFPRTYLADVERRVGLREFVLGLLRELESTEADLKNPTVTISAECGAGLSTLARSVAFDVARLGYPTLLLRQDQVGFSVDALTAFLNRLQQRTKSDLDFQRELPTLIIFDAQHAHIEPVHQLAQTLSLQGRPAVVLRAERSRDEGPDAEEPSKPRVRGRRVPLPTLSSQVEEVELKAICQHFQNIAERYPLIGLDPPSLSEWQQYQKSRSMAGPDGLHTAESLFWVALYFFLCARDQPPEGFDDWIWRAFAGVDSPDVREAVKRIAAFSSFGLLTPLVPLLRSIGKGRILDLDLVRGLQRLDDEAALIRWGSRPEDLEDQALFFRHPLIAQRLLERSDPSIAWFPVELTWPVLESLVAGHVADTWLAERLTFDVLRTERRQATSSAQLNLILETFRRIPPEISDRHKTVLHHWARALYHVGRESQDPEQCQLLLREAIEKLQRAVALPDEPGRGEHPSHLYNTLGTVYAELHKRQIGREAGADRLWDRACQCFEKSLQLSSDNFEALVAYAWRLVLRAEQLGTEDPAGAADMAARALSYLQQSEDVASDPGELSVADKGWMEMCRNRVWSVLEPSRADEHIRRLMESGEEAGYLLTAYRTLRGASLAEPTRDDHRRIGDAVEILRPACERLDPELGWRIPYLLYRLYSVLPEMQYRFDERLRLLERLERTDFGWPLRLRFEKAVLCYQGDRFVEGERQFRLLRTMIRQGRAPARRFVDFWRDKTEPTRARAATIRVRRVDSEWRAYGAVPEMGGQEVLLRPRHFHVLPKVGDYRPCLVRFETNGPIAVPPAFASRPP